MLHLSFTYFWLALAVGLAILEINTANLVCLWFIFGSAAAFGVSFITGSLVAQAFAFALASALALWVTKPLADKLVKKTPVPTNFDMLIGRQADLTAEIAPPAKGRMTLDGVSWLAAADGPIPKGKKVEVVFIIGNTLHVKEVN